MTRLIQKLMAVFFRRMPEGNYFSSYLINNSVQLFLLQCISLVLVFCSNYVLIKVVGVDAYGQYVYLFNFIYLLVNFCIVGGDTLLTRNIPLYNSRGNYKSLKGVIIFGSLAAILGSFLAASVSEIVIDLSGTLKFDTSFNWFFLALSSLILLSLSRILQAILQGSNKIVLSQLAEKIIKPSLVIIFALVIFYSQRKVSFNELVWVNLVAIGISAGISFILYKRNVGSSLKSLKPSYEFKTWVYSSSGFFLLGVLYILNSRIDIFLLGLLRGNEEVGIYNIVLKISEVISFGLVIINFVLAPVIAKLYATGEMVQLQVLIKKSAQMILLLSLPLVLLIFFFRENLLSFFGVDLLNGNKALAILCIGQLINVLCGSVGTVLIMTGHQKFSVYALVVSTVVNIILNILLTPRYGVVGTAIATAGSLMMWNLLMYWFVRKKVKIFPTAFQSI